MREVFEKLSSLSSFHYWGFYPQLLGRFLRVTHPFATHHQNFWKIFRCVQLACVKPIASVHSGPGSNPTVILKKKGENFFITFIRDPKLHLEKRILMNKTLDTWVSFLVIIKEFKKSEILMSPILWSKPYMIKGSKDLSNDLFERSSLHFYNFIITKLEWIREEANRVDCMDWSRM